jgi:hypothetical protein
MERKLKQSGVNVGRKSLGPGKGVQGKSEGKLRRTIEKKRERVRKTLGEKFLFLCP